MAIGINNVMAAGSIQVNRPTLETTDTKGQTSRLPNLAASSATAVNPARGTELTIPVSETLASLETQNRAAQLVRQSNTTLDEVGNLLGKMGGNLGLIVKQYPPYAPEDKERMALLNSLSGLRKQIDALTYPPPEQGSISQPADSVVTGGGGEIQFQLAGMTHTIHPRLPLTESGGLDIPVLGDTASDAEVEQAYAQVLDAQAKLRARREALANELAGVLLPRQNQAEELAQASRADLASYAGTLSKQPGSVSLFGS